MKRFLIAILAFAELWAIQPGSFGRPISNRFAVTKSAAESPNSSGRTYYISPSGNDGNSGLSGSSPWLSPNHSVNCGDTILAIAGNYKSAHFIDNQWGTVLNCPSKDGIYVARLLCAGPYVSSCSITDTAHDGMRIDKSNWAVSGWTVSSKSGACFGAVPSGLYNIHYVAFINVVADGCENGGIAVYSYYRADRYGVDEVAAVGAIIYNASRGPSECFSGLSIYEPVNVDNNPGTHIFVAGVFSIGNINPAPCAGGAPTDGEGFIFDTFSRNGYSGQSVVEQSMALANGSAGFEVFKNTAAPIYILSSTAWGNFRDANHITGGGELLYNATSAVTTAIGNILEATLAVQNFRPIYGVAVYEGGPTNVIRGNYILGVGGNNAENADSRGFSFGANTYATPNFFSPSIPGTPNCSGFATTTACMKATIADFVPRAPGARRLGYKVPGPCTPDPQFPIWLKGVIPVGLITKPCGT